MKKTILAMFMAGLMIVSIFSAISVNAGTGESQEVTITDIEVKPLDDGDENPLGAGNSWTNFILDEVGMVGDGNSVAVDSKGHPHIAYTDDDDRNLKYAHWTGSQWVFEVVDEDDCYMRAVSIAIDKYDNPHICYRDEWVFGEPEDNSGLKYAAFVNGEWEIEYVFKDYYKGVFMVLFDITSSNALVLDADDTPHIAFRQVEFNPFSSCTWVKYTRRTGTSWETDDVDFVENSDIGWSLSLVVDTGGKAHLSYLYDYHSALKYACYDGEWDVQVVKSGNIWNPSLAVDSKGNVHISYISDLQNFFLMYAYFDESWTFKLLDSAYPGEGNPIVVDQNDNPHICYVKRPTSLIKHIYYSDGWYEEIVNQIPNSAFCRLALAIGRTDNLLHLTYLELSYRDLHFATTNPSITSPQNAPDPPVIDGSTSGNAGEEYDYTFVTTDPDGDNVYYYIDWGDDQIEDWFGPFESGEEVTKSHTWADEGTYDVKAKAKDTYGVESDWSDPLSVTMPKNKQLIKLQTGIYIENAEEKIPFPITIFVGDADIEIDAEGASKVELYIDEQPRYSADEEPYEWLWDEFSFGPHTLKVIAYDNEGNSDTDEMKVWKFF